ncbi:MAG TPA: signal peptidase II [Eubacteriaceae bacterium]|nr:signal peptidase II [Eubacteriaceae bacterium]
MPIVIIFVLIALDQISKYLVLNWLKPIGTLPLIDGIFHLTYAENTGAAFSIFTDMQLFLKIITSIFIGLLLFLLYLEMRKKHAAPLKLFSLSLIIGGAIGNLIDRFRFNFVVDFFDFRLIDFAIFNLADSFIVIGTILLVFVIITTPEEDWF